MVAATHRGQDGVHHDGIMPLDLVVTESENPKAQSGGDRIPAPVFFEFGTRRVELGTVDFEDEARAEHEIHSSDAGDLDLLSRLQC